MSLLCISAGVVVWRSKNKDTEKKKPTKVGLGRQPDSVMMVILFIMLRAIHVIVPASTGPSTTGRRHLLNSSDDLPVGGFPKWSRSNEVTNQLRILEQPTRNIRYNLPENKATASSSWALLCTVHTRWLFLFFSPLQAPLAHPRST